MPISPNFTSIFSKEWEINFTQCYPNGYLKHTDLCHLLQLTAAAHSELGGISFSDMQEFHQAWVLSRMRVEIESMPRWKDVVTVKTWVASLENSKSIRALEVYLNGKKIVGCQTFWVVFNTQKRRPEALSLPISHFELYPNKIATRLALSKINLEKEQEIIAHREVMLSDLDIVNHVNNVKYLEWCLDYVPTDCILDHQIKSFDMNFTKELSLNDVISIHKNQKENQHTLSIYSGDKLCFALNIEAQ